MREWVIPLHDDICKELLVLKNRNQLVYQCNDKSLKSAQIFNVTLHNPRYHGKQMTEEQLSGFFRNLSRKTNIKCSAHHLDTD